MVKLLQWLSSSSAGAFFSGWSCMAGIACINAGNLMLAGIYMFISLGLFLTSAAYKDRGKL
jgi:hypothetical protein